MGVILNRIACPRAYYGVWKVVGAQNTLLVGILAGNRILTPWWHAGSEPPPPKQSKPCTLPFPLGHALQRFSGDVGGDGGRGS